MCDHSMNGSLCYILNTSMHTTHSGNTVDEPTDDDTLHYMSVTEEGSLVKNRKGRFFKEGSTLQQ